MRHLGSIVLSLVLAAAVYLLVGIGMGRLANALVDVRDYGNEAIGVAAMLAAGALYMLMVLPRFSPLGPLLAALAYLGVQAYAMVPSLHFLENFADPVLGTRGVLTTPTVFGIPLLLAIPLLATLLSPQRWRGRAQPAAAAPFAAAPPTFPPYSPPVPGSAYNPPPTSGYPPPPLYPTEPPISGTPAHAAPDDDSSATRPLYQPPPAPPFGQPSSGAPSYPPPPMPSYPPPHSNFAPPGYAPPPSSGPPSSGPPSPPPFPAAPARSYGAPTYGTGEPPPVPSGSVDPEPPPDPDTTRKL